MEILLDEEHDSRSRSLSIKAHKFILLGLGWFIIRGKTVDKPETISKHCDLIVKRLLDMNHFPVISELFSSSTKFKVPEN